jgi:hypothetical protein
MGKLVSRHGEVSRVHYFPTHLGNRAIFLAEARSKKETRQISELFDMVGQLAEVVNLSHGAVMSYAVQVGGDASLFTKIEWLLKTQFTFSLVERNLSEVTFHLIRSLCDDANAQMAELPECGICQTTDPFPTRVTLELQGDAEPLHRAYCARCSARFSETEPAQAAHALISRDQLKLRISRDVPVVEVPEIVDERPQWQADDAFAIAI